MGCVVRNENIRWPFTLPGSPERFLSHLCATQKESFAKLASRATLLPWPGFGDHFPYNYAGALREELELQQPLQ